MARLLDDVHDGAKFGGILVDDRGHAHADFCEARFGGMFVDERHDGARLLGDVHDGTRFDDFGHVFCFHDFHVVKFGGLFYVVRLPDDFHGEKFLHEFHVFGGLFYVARLLDDVHGEKFLHEFRPSFYVARLGEMIDGHGHERCYDRSLK